MYEDKTKSIYKFVDNKTNTLLHLIEIFNRVTSRDKCDIRIVINKHTYADNMC